MLACTGLLPRRIARCVHARQPSNKRFFVQSLCDGFLDLAIALPFPPSVPSYSATIILVTVASRVALFPLALWGRNNLRCLEDVVLPEFERSKPIISRQVLNDVKRLTINNKQVQAQALQQLHLRRTKEKFQAERKRLLAEHKCHPLLAMVIGPATQLPVFVVMSMVFNRLARDPTPFDSEAFFTLTSLNHPDPTWTIPIILGVVTMANVESNHWFMSAVQKTRMAEREQQAAAGDRRVSPNLMRSVLNGLSVARIILASFSPGSVALYWTTSAACGLVQTWFLDRFPSPQRTPTVKAPKSPDPQLAPASIDRPAKKQKKTRP